MFTLKLEPNISEIKKKIQTKDVQLLKYFATELTHFMNLHVVKNIFPGSMNCTNNYDSQESTS